MRIDQLLVQRGMAASRAQAQRLINAGAVQWRAGTDGAAGSAHMAKGVGSAHAGGPASAAGDSPVGWRSASKPGLDVPAEAALRLSDDAQSRYVSRGGLKLQAALAAAALDVRGWCCLDVGQSTGGFTDCLLQHGARAVLGVDVGHGQLHPRLRVDARVHALEGLNARALSASDLIAAYADLMRATGSFDANYGDDLFDLAVMDVAFISQTLVLPRLPALLRPGGWLISLVKPQFELQPHQVGKGGVVRDASLYPQVKARVQAAGVVCGLAPQRWLDSPIVGSDGNREFLFLAKKPSSAY